MFITWWEALSLSCSFQRHHKRTAADVVAKVFSLLLQTHQACCFIRTAFCQISKVLEDMLNVVKEEKANF